MVIVSLHETGLAFARWRVRCNRRDGHARIAAEACDRYIRHDGGRLNNGHLQFVPSLDRNRRSKFAAPRAACRDRSDANRDNSWNSSTF
ncbi:MAG: hypothetical protein ABIQ97_06945 [Lysobacteraceae bacterium]